MAYTFQFHLIFNIVNSLFYNRYNTITSPH